jgi:Uma2 family endonuclease
MSTTQSITTARQLLEASGLGRCELIGGKLKMMSPGGFRHGRVASTIDRMLGNFVSERGLGTVLGPETGFHIARDPDTVRAPDVAFVRADRLPETEPVGFFPGAPDLAVEVVSPSDRASELLIKVQDWLEAGCRAVWVADPQTRTVTVYRAGGESVVLTADRTLDAGDVLPGFRTPVAELFAGHWRGSPTRGER